MNDSTLRVWMTSFVTLAGVVMFAFSVTMENPIGQPIGPGYVPTLVALWLTVAAGWATVSDVRRMRRERLLSVKPAEPEDDESKGGELRVFLCAAASVIGAFVWDWAGYTVGLSLAVLAMILIDRKMSPKWGVLYTAAVTLCLWLIFVVALQVNMG
jgi:hypothetical protein